MNADSLSYWIERLNDGDLRAVEHVFRVYEPFLRIAVRRRLSRRLQAKVDSQDIVQSIFADVVDGVRKGGWRFAGRPELFAFLRRLAWRRLADRYHKHRQSLEREQSLAETSPVNLPATDMPRPSQVAQGREFWERILQACSPAHHDIVRMRMNGLRLSEIAARTGMHAGSVRRVIYDVARRLSVSRRTGVGPAEGND